MTTPAQQELRDLIAAKIDENMRSERMDDHFDGRDYADAVMELFHEVVEERDSIDITTLGEPPRSRELRQRWLIARAPREAEELTWLPTRKAAP